MWSKKMIGPRRKKSFNPEEIFGLKIFFLDVKNFGLKNILCPKKIWSEENFSSKKKFG